MNTSITLQSCEVIGSMEQVYTANSEAFHAHRMYNQNME